jgi:hypothetical protein
VFGNSCSGMDQRPSPKAQEHYNPTSKRPGVRATRGAFARIHRRQQVPVLPIGNAASIAIQKNRHNVEIAAKASPAQRRTIRPRA